MELGNYRKNFRRVPVKLFYLDENDSIKEETLDVKYKPITQAWLDENERIQEKILQKTKEGLELARAADETQALVVKLRSEAIYSGSIELEEAEVKSQEAAAKVEAYLAEAKEMAKRLLAEHLSPILIDLDITNKGKKVEPTVEFLATCDLEFLQDIAETVKKRTFRAQTKD